MTRSQGVAVVLCFTCVSCVQSSGTEASTPHAGFKILLTLSKAAADLLAQRHETALAFGYYFGFPKSETPRKYVSDMGEVGGLGDFSVEGSPESSLTVPASAFPNSALNRIRGNEGPEVLVNVVSGRKSSRNNLLDCTIYEGSFKKIENTSVPISCKLISE